MKHDFSEIELAFEHVSMSADYDTRALLCRETGRIYLLSDFDDLDDDVPEDAEESDQYIDIPNKYDLDLGVALVRRFIRSEAPELIGEVEAIFSRRGAYARFKDLLLQHDLLQSWYGYEAAETTAALKTWCAANDIELAEE